VVAVASGHVFATQRLLPAFMPKSDRRAGAFQDDIDHLRLIQRRHALLGKRVHQVARNFRLSIDRNAAAGQRVEIDAMPSTPKAQFDAFVQETVAAAAGAYAGFVQEFDRNLFQHAGADAAKHVFPAAPLQDQIVDAGAEEQPGKKQSRWPCSDNCDLRPHSMHVGGRLAIHGVLMVTSLRHLLPGSENWRHADDPAAEMRIMPLNSAQANGNDLLPIAPLAGRSTTT
jgi:hypothetical protein